MAVKHVAKTQPSAARRLWRVARAVLYMMRRGLPSGRKLAMDLHLLLRRDKMAAGKALGRKGRLPDDGYYRNYDAADVARVFEMLNNDSGLLFDDGALAVALDTATPWTPSPAFRHAPVSLRVTDSPFAGGEPHVDEKADEFIRRFYEQLRAQQSVAATPDYYGYTPRPYNGQAPRPVAAGIAYSIRA